MKIPKIFTVEGKEREIKKHPKKQYKRTIEDFVDKQLMEYQKLDVYDINMALNPDFLKVRGIEPEIIEKAVFAHYGDNTIMLVQYKTKEDLTKNLRKLFKKGILFYENHCEAEFIERFLFKDNITVYLQGNDDFNKKAANHYSKKGFKQLEYELKVV